MRLSSTTCLSLNPRWLGPMPRPTTHISYRMICSEMGCRRCHPSHTAGLNGFGCSRAAGRTELCPALHFVSDLLLWSRSHGSIRVPKGRSALRAATFGAAGSIWDLFSCNQRLGTRSHGSPASWRAKQCQQGLPNWAKGGRWRWKGGRQEKHGHAEGLVPCAFAFRD